MQSSAIFPLFYLPPIAYFSSLKQENYQVLFEKFEHFPKQTYRNRASIASPDGILDLIVPVVKGSKVHTPFKDVKISYDLKWQRLHWLSLQNCYRSSAYFEFYEDGLAPFYEKKYSHLIDLNQGLLEWLLVQLKQKQELQFTNKYSDNISDSNDFRSAFNKKELHLNEAKPYFQVFSDRNPFISNLSVLDLLFNQGPQSNAYF